MQKLLIWDFDGVIADTEHVAMKAWQQALQSYGINLSFNETVHCIMGIGQKLQLLNLQVYNDVLTAADIERINCEVNRKIQDDLMLTEGIEDIFKMHNFAQCIATGNSPEGIKARVKPLHLERYFKPNQIFSASFVKYGKPEPDLFLYAARQMGFAPKDCIVIEDSLAGLTAGLRASMKVVAYVEHSVLDINAYIKEVKNIGIKHIFKNMAGLRNFLVTQSGEEIAQ